MKRFYFLSFIFVITLLASNTSADLISSESFDYSSGIEIKTLGGGVGWSQDWNGDSEPRVADSGLTYFDTAGNELIVSGNAARGSVSDGKKVERDLSVVATTVWTSVLINGKNGSGVANFSFDQKLFIGQGHGDIAGTTWTMYDQDGLVRNSNQAVDSDTVLLVSLIEFSSGDERAWFWINPSLDAEPSKSSSINGALGDSVKEFEISKAQVWVGGSDAIVDEIRIGTTFADVTPFIAIPEPSCFALAMFGILGLIARSRNKNR